MLRHRVLSALLVLFPSLAVAEPMGVELSFELQLGLTPAVTTTATGMAQSLPSGFSLPAGVFLTSTVESPGFSATPIVSLSFSNASGTFLPVGSFFAGPMGVPGVVRYCLLSPSCAGGVLTQTLTQGGVSGVGLGGMITFGVGFQHGPASGTSTAVTSSLRGGQWRFSQVTADVRGFVHGAASLTSTTIGTAQAAGFAHGPTSGTGFIHGPASLTSTSLQQSSGVLQMVTPIQTLLSGDLSPRRGFARMVIHFVPEPGAIVLLVAGAFGLAALAMRRS